MRRTIKTEARHVIQEKIENSLMTDEMKAALLLALDETQEKRNIATVMGSFTNGGADDLQLRVCEYVNGWNHEATDWLDEYMWKSQHEMDVEFAEYRRLYEKFKGREPRRKTNVTKIKSNEDPMKGFI